MRLVAASLAVSLPLAQSFGLGPAPVAPRATAPAGRCAGARASFALGEQVESLLKPLGSLVPKPNAKPAIGDSLPDCPSTKWEADGLDVDEWQAKLKAEDLPACPFEVVATNADNAEGEAYFVRRRDEFKEMLLKHGTIWFRGFNLMTDPDGFRTFWESLGLDPCLDPIHSSGLRKFLSQRDALYEEVNKQSLSRHFIGLHQEMTEKKTATAGAFVCFQPATVSGGEFFIADGERIFRDMCAPPGRPRRGWRRPDRPRRARRARLRGPDAPPRPPPQGP